MQIPSPQPHCGKDALPMTYTPTMQTVMQPTSVPGLFKVIPVPRSVVATMEIQQPWLDEILRGRKTVEGRVGEKGKYDQLINHHVRVHDLDDKTSGVVFVNDIVHYDTFDQYLKRETWIAVAPHTGSEEEARVAYAAITLPDGTAVFGEKRVLDRGGINAIHINVV